MYILDIFMTCVVAMACINELDKSAGIQMKINLDRLYLGLHKFLVAVAIQKAKNQETAILGDPCSSQTIQNFFDVKTDPYRFRTVESSDVFGNKLAKVFYETVAPNKNICCKILFILHQDKCELKKEYVKKRRLNLTLIFKEQTSKFADCRSLTIEILRNHWDILLFMLKQLFEVPSIHSYQVAAIGSWVALLQIIHLNV
ncbi:hypothetical protein NQ317_000201 [Molorchus minor]|uniref:Uncharacterized protein n=1 Tax=Molorchus minor TaxID=1323400 RepID=A0ABQ9JC44_9CUCU|nr:hypothetical protein NQ317_000201 [Molorchus minor]